jgi:predicted transcriptional regulator
MMFMFYVSKSLTESQLIEIMGFPRPSMINVHLGKLLKAGLIEKTGEEYRISEWGKHILEESKLAQALEEFLKREGLSEQRGGRTG